MTTLQIQLNDTYTINSNTTEQYSELDCKGTLACKGTLDLSGTTRSDSQNFGVNLTNPQSLNSELLVFIFSFFSIFGFIGYKLRSSLVFIVWGLSIIMFIFAIVFNSSFVWIWILFLFCILTTLLAGIMQYIITPELS